MNLFLKKTTKFLIILCFSAVSISLLLNSYLNKKSKFSLNNNVKSVVFGHSHPETAFNDSLIVDFKNLAQSGESYFYTYIKAKQVFKNNPQIENVFIEFSNIDITKIRDEEIWNDKYINWRYPTYATWMNLQEHFFLLLKNPKSLIATLPKTYKKQVKRIKTKHFNYTKSTSGYLYINESKLDSLLQNRANTIQPEPNFFKESSHNLMYLKKLVALCQQHNKSVYFVRSPIYHESFYKWNELLFKEVKEKHFSKIELLDYVDLKLPINHFRDLHHLNYKGAKIFSQNFNNWLLNKKLHP